MTASSALELAWAWRASPASGDAAREGSGAHEFRTWAEHRLATVEPEALPAEIAALANVAAAAARAGLYDGLGAIGSERAALHDEVLVAVVREAGAACARPDAAPRALAELRACTAGAPQRAERLGQAARAIVREMGARGDRAAARQLAELAAHELRQAIATAPAPADVALRRALRGLLDAWSCQLGVWEEYEAALAFDDEVLALMRDLAAATDASPDDLFQAARWTLRRSVLLGEASQARARSASRSWIDGDAEPGADGEHDLRAIAKAEHAEEERVLAAEAALVAEAERWLDPVPAPDRDAPDVVHLRAQVLIARARLRRQGHGTGDPVAALLEARRLAASLGEARATAHARAAVALASLARADQDPALARQYEDEALGALRAAAPRNPVAAAMLIEQLGQAALRTEAAQPATALALHEEALATSRALVERGALAPRVLLERIRDVIRFVDFNPALDAVPDDTIDVLLEQLGHLTANLAGSTDAEADADAETDADADAEANADTGAEAGADTARAAWACHGDVARTRAQRAAARGDDATAFQLRMREVAARRRQAAGSAAYGHQWALFMALAALAKAALAVGDLVRATTSIEEALARCRAATARLPDRHTRRWDLGAVLLVASEVAEARRRPEMVARYRCEAALALGPSPWGDLN